MDQGNVRIFKGKCQLKFQCPISNTEIKHVFLKVLDTSALKNKLTEELSCKVRNLKSRCLAHLWLERVSLAEKLHKVSIDFLIALCWNPVHRHCRVYTDWLIAGIIHWHFFWCTEEFWNISVGFIHSFFWDKQHKEDGGYLLFL